MSTGKLSADELLWRIQAEERRGGRGRLKIFLGYASRVGKTLRMFDEGRRRKERGQDVLMSADDGAVDVAAILQRRPEVYMVDRLAYRNPPGSPNAERWQDVEQILQAGISVITAINVQYVAEQQEAVERLTGKRAACSVPEQFLREADEIEMVDAPPDTATGDARVLAELRELALLLAADVVERQLQEYLDAHGIAASWGTQERILVCLTPRSNARAMLEAGQRTARSFHGTLLAAYVEQAGLSADDVSRLESNLQMARAFGAEVHRLQGSDFVSTLVEFGRRQRVTQLYLGHSQRDRDPLEKLIDAAEEFDLQVFPSAEAR